MDAASTLPRNPEGAPASDPASNERLYRELANRFSVLAEACARLAHEVYLRSGVTPAADPTGTVTRNLTIARTIFSKWSIDILAILYLQGNVAFDDLRAQLGRISPRVLTAKLRSLERAGLAQRTNTWDRPAKARYALTHKGSMITRLGEPVFLYLRLADGWFPPAVSEALSATPADASAESASGTPANAAAASAESAPRSTR